MTTNNTLKTTKMDHTTIKFGMHTTGTNNDSTNTEQSGSILTQAAVKPMGTIHAGDESMDDWEGEGKYGVPLEDMFASRDLVEKRGSVGGEV